MDQLERDSNFATDRRVNAAVVPLDIEVSGPSSLAQLRERWAKMDSIPKLLASRNQGVDVSFGQFDVRRLLSGEESSGRYAFHSIILPPGAEIPAHSVDDAAAFWFVLSSEVEITIGSSVAKMGAKAFAFAPEQTSQAIVNRSASPAEVIVGHSPAGAERAFASAHRLAQTKPDSDAAAYWSIFTKHAFNFTGGKPLPNDTRTNATVARIDSPIESLSDFEALRARWSELSPTPKIVPFPHECQSLFNVDLGLESWVVLTPEESGAKATIFSSGLMKGLGAPPHHQPTEDEVFILVDGQLNLSIGNMTEPAAQHGAFAFAPRCCTHGFRNEMDKDMLWFTMNAPGGHDRGLKLTMSLQDMPQEKRSPVMYAHGLAFHDPL